MSHDPTEVVGEQVEWKSGVYNCVGYHGGPVYVMSDHDGRIFVASAGDVHPVMPQDVRKAARLVSNWYTHEPRTNVKCPCCRAYGVASDPELDAGVAR